MYYVLYFLGCTCTVRTFGHLFPLLVYRSDVKMRLAGKLCGSGVGWLHFPSVGILPENMVAISFAVLQENGTLGLGLERVCYRSTSLACRPVNHHPHCPHHHPQLVLGVHWTQCLLA